MSETTMNLTVEWVHFGDFVQGPGTSPGTSNDYIPVIRVATLQGFMQGVREALLVGYLPTDPMIIAINNLLAQLPEEGV